MKKRTARKRRPAKAPAESTPMRTRRLAMGISLLRLSKIADVPYSTVQRIDAGGGAGFAVETKKKIAAALQAEVLQLFPEILNGLHRLQCFVLAEPEPPAADQDDETPALPFDEKTKDGKR